MSPAAFPVADRDRIVGHMNDDHADAVLHYVQAWGRRPLARSARLVDLDYEGMDIVAAFAAGEEKVRVPYPSALKSPAEAHGMLVRMARDGAGPARSTPAADEARERRAAEATELLRTQVRTLVLGTVSAEGEPEASVAAAIPEGDGVWVVWVSRLSRHTAHLEQTGRASVLLIEDEASSAHPLARRRLTCSCRAERVPEEDPGRPALAARLEDRYGAVARHLTGMSDFLPFRLTAFAARLVAGFGQAYDIEPLRWDVRRHLADTGHTPREERA